MERDIGLDAHASSCTLGVMTPSGRRIGSHVALKALRWAWMALADASSAQPGGGSSASTAPGR
jgi:hypothetical protein